MKKFYLLIYFLSFLSVINAQDLIENTQNGIDPTTPKFYNDDNVFDQKLREKSGKEVKKLSNLFSVDQNKSAALKNAIENVIKLDIDEKQLQLLVKERPDLISIDVPVDDKNTFTLSLIKAKSITETFTMNNASGDDLGPIKEIGVHYHGIIEGNRLSFASVSIHNDEFHAVLGDEYGNYNFHKIGKNKNLLYNDRNVKKQKSFTCGNENEEPSPIVLERIRNLYDEQGKLKTEKSLKVRDRIEVLVEVDNDIVDNFGGSVSAVFQHVINIFRNSADIYERDGVSIRLNNLIVWEDGDGADPFQNGSISDSDDLYDAMHDWASNVRDYDFPADVAHYIRRSSPSSGWGHGIGGICDKNELADIIDFDILDFETSHCVSSGIAASGYSETDIHDAIESGVFTSPTWTLNVFTHELGHVFGSPHTHGCYWGANNNNRIDDCGNVTANNAGNTPEGNPCWNSNNPILPANGGTIMSYCHQIATTDMNLVNSFGSEPGALIRSTLNGSGCFDSLEEPCPEIEVLESSIGSSIFSLTYDAEDDLIVYDADIIVTPFPITLTAGNETVIHGNFTCPTGAGFTITTTGCTNN